MGPGQKYTNLDTCFPPLWSKGIMSAFGEMINLHPFGSLVSLKGSTHLSLFHTMLTAT